MIIGKIISTALEKLIVGIGEIFHNGGPHHIETSPLICRESQWSSFYMIRISVTKELTTETGTVWTFTLQKIDMFSTMLWSLKYVKMESIRFIKMYQGSM